jgi:hypothetical protein
MAVELAAAEINQAMGRVGLRCYVHPNQEQILVEVGQLQPTLGRGRSSYVHAVAVYAYRMCVRIISPWLMSCHVSSRQFTTFRQQSKGAVAKEAVLHDPHGRSISALVAVYLAPAALDEGSTSLVHWVGYP